MIEALRPKVALCSVDESIEQLRDMLAKHFDVKVKACMNERELVEFAADANGILVDLLPVTKRAVERLPNCKSIVLYSAGYDYVDYVAATERGITVSNMPDYCVEEVADHAIAMALALARKLFQANSDVKNKVWDWPKLRPIKAFKDSVIGIIGLGHTGSVAALRARSFGMRVLEYDPYIPPGREKIFGAEAADLELLLRESDIITLHVPLTKETHHMIGESQLRAMKKTAYLVNTSRGKVVDTTSLCRAAKEGWIAGAALDVLEEEPPDASDPLLSLPNIILSPHTAFYSERSIEDKQKKVVEEFLRVLNGRPARYKVQPAIYE
jgi:D-3-phosphoglycerate dehydrogenase